MNLLSSTLLFGQVFLARTVTVVRELLLKIMAVLAKVSTLHEQLPSVLLDPCLYYCCTAHQALAALRSLCTEGYARTVRSTCVGVHNFIREFIWTALLYSSSNLGQVFLARTVCVYFACRVSSMCVLHNYVYTLRGLKYT